MEMVVFTHFFIIKIQSRHSTETTTIFSSGCCGVVPGGKSTSVPVPPIKKADSHRSEFQNGQMKAVTQLDDVSPPNQ